MLIKPACFSKYIIKNIHTILLDQTLSINVEHSDEMNIKVFIIIIIILKAKMITLDLATNLPG